MIADGYAACHRNTAIADAQGNRNPLIDHPEWAERVDFEASFAR